jgi:hypothetical protein
MQQLAEFKTGGGSGFATGTICTDTNLYKCTDNKVVYIEYIAAGTAFPNFPGGNGKGKANWFKITEATDGGTSDFQAVQTTVTVA